MPQPQAFDPNEFGVQAFDPNEFAPQPTKSPDQMSDLERTVLGLPPKQEPSWWDTAKSAWDWAVSAPEFIAEPVARKAMEFSEWINPERAADYSPRSLISAYAESLGNVVPTLASPLNLATAGAFSGAGVAAKHGLPVAAKGLTQVGRGLSVPVAAEGAYHVATAEDLPTALLGGVEAVGGVLGAKAKVPTGKPLPVKQPAAPIDVTPESMPVRPPLVEGMSGSREVLPLNRPAPIEAPPPAQAFDPNTLVGLEKATPPELQFVNPQTGEVRPASLAQPGDIPLIPEAAPTPPRRAGSRMGQPELGPALPESRPPVSNQDMFRLSEELEARPRPAPPEQMLPHEFQPDRQLVSEPVPETGGMTTREVVPEAAPPPKGGTFIDWLNELARGESGEFDVDALLGRRAEPETPPARRDISENVSRENRNFVDNLPDEALRDYIARFENNPNYARNTVGGDILEYGRNVLEQRTRLADDVANLGLDRLTPEQASDAMRHYENTGRTDLVDYLTSRYQRTRTQPSVYDLGEMPRQPVRTGWESFETSTLDQPPELPVRAGKTLEEVEAGKRTPGLERLGKMIGEERASQIASGERPIEFSESARRTRGKRLPRSTTEDWGAWGDAQVKDVTPDPAKPGLTVEPHNISNLFPKAFSIAYRDASGNPIGVLHTDLQGTGISTLAVDSKIGLRRGKVAFEMLKEAFDRGINEPSGPVSDLTRNLIERVKRLASSESGEFDADVVIDAFNKMIGAVSRSKIGQAVGRFIKGESGEVDMDRLRALFRKQQEGTITPDELAQAKAMAQEYQASRQAAPTAGTRVTQDLSQRLKTETGGGAGQPPRPPRRPLLDESQLDPDIPVVNRKPPEPGIEQSMLAQVWNAPRSLQSIDLPGITSAALRQSRPLSFTADWFKAWNSAFKSFGSKGALDAINTKISNSKYFRPRYQPVVNRAGEVVKYIEKPSIAEELGVKMTDVINHREEAIVSSLAEKIPGYGRYVKASNRAYTGFLNDLRAAKFEQLMDAAKALGRDPEIDTVLGKKLADFVNNATGRGSLKYFGDKLNLEVGPIPSILGVSLYSPRALSARLAFMNPANYTVADPFIRQEYWKGLARIGVGWGAASGLASLMPGVHVSMDPNNADFGKIRIGNTRIDPGAGFQQLLVLANRELPQVLGGGGTVTSTGPAGQPGKFTPFGSTPMSATRLSLAGRYLYNQMNPSLRFVFDMLSASRREPFDLTDRTLQAVLPMYVADIAEAAKGDSSVAEFFAPLLSSMGTGVQTYERGSFNKPQITPFIEQVTGVKLPTAKIGGR